MKCIFDGETSGEFATKKKLVQHHHLNRYKQSHFINVLLMIAIKILNVKWQNKLYTYILINLDSRILLVRINKMNKILPVLLEIKDKYVWYSTLPTLL